MASAAVNAMVSGSVVVDDSFLVDALIVCGGFVCSVFCYAEICVLNSSVTILPRKRDPELVTLL